MIGNTFIYKRLALAVTYVDLEAVWEIRGGVSTVLGRNNRR